MSKKPSPRNWHEISDADKEKIKKRLAKYQFKKGHVPSTKNPPWKPPHIQLREAIQEQRRLGYDPIRAFIEQAKKNPMLMKALLDKMVANKIQIGLGPDDLTDIINSVVGIIGKHVKDHTIREAIAKDLEELEFDEQLRKAEEEPYPYTQQSVRLALAMNNLSHQKPYHGDSKFDRHGNLYVYAHDTWNVYPIAQIPLKNNTWLSLFCNRNGLGITSEKPMEFEDSETFHET